MHRRDGIANAPPTFEELDLPPRYERPPVYREQPIPIGETPLIQSFYHEFQGRIVAEAGSEYGPNFKEITTK